VRGRGLPVEGADGQRAKGFVIEELVHGEAISKGNRLRICFWLTRELVSYVHYGKHVVERHGDESRNPKTLPAYERPRTASFRFALPLISVRHLHQSDNS
jgi:hypothetical protein